MAVETTPLVVEEDNLNYASLAAYANDSIMLTSATFRLHSYCMGLIKFKIRSKSIQIPKEFHRQQYARMNTATFSFYDT